MLAGPFRVVFEPPPDFKDWTHYSFTETAQRELVSVGYGNVPNSAETARDILVQRQGELVDLREYDPALAIEPISNMMIGTIPGAVLSFTAREVHYQFREWWAVALLDRVSYIQIIYHTSALNAAAGER